MNDLPVDAQAACVLRGQGLYTGDVARPEALAVAFLRADRAHADLLALDTAPALAVPGVVAVLTADDLGPLGTTAAFLNQPTVDGRPLVVPRRPVLAEGRVRHVGELVAMVVAATEAAALDGVEALAPEWADLPPVVGLDATGPTIHPEAPDNVAARVALGEAEAAEATLGAAATVVEATVAVPRVAPFPLEPRCVIAAFDPASGVLDLWTPHQGINEVRRDVCAVLGLSPAAVRVHAQEVGGAFGARGAAYPELLALAAAARRLGQPLRWQGTRSEMFLTDYAGRGTRLRGRLGLDASGRFTAIAVEAEADLGAYVNPVAAHISVANPAQTLTGCYRIPARALTVTLRFSTVTPLGPYRGAGRPDIALLVERLVDEAATRTGRDPVALRRLNALRPEDFPHRTVTGLYYDSGDYAGLLDLAAATPLWAGRQARREAAAARGLLAGTGLALFTEVAGGGPVPRDEVRLRLATVAGEPQVTVETTTKGSGQGHDAVWRGMVADRLGLAPEAVRLEESPPDTALVGAGSFASRSTAAVGNALVAGCAALVARLVARTAEALDLDPDALVCDGQAIRRADGTVAATLGAALAEAAADGLAVTGAAPVGSTFPSGCHVAAVEIDPETGRLAVTGYAAVDDAGRVLSHAHVEGQVMGGIAQGLGSGLAERLVVDDEGQLLTASLMDYGVPRARDIPPITIGEYNIPSPSNALGVKGVGEAGATGALAAIANAVADALRAVGMVPPAMPYTPECLWAALNGARPRR